MELSLPDPWRKKKKEGKTLPAAQSMFHRMPPDNKKEYAKTDIYWEAVS